MGFVIVCSSCGNAVSKSYPVKIGISAWIQCAKCLWDKYQQSKSVNKMDVERKHNQEDRK